MKWALLKIRMMKFVIASLFVFSCANNQSSFSLLPTGQTFKQAANLVNSKIDILWVIDNSGSMSPSQQNILNNFSAFMNNFIAKKLDFQMAVTTTDAYKAGAFFANNAAYTTFKDGATFTKNGVTYNKHTGIDLIYPGVSADLTATFVVNGYQGDQGSGDERAFSSFMSALGDKTNPLLIRQNSYLAVIILSDEDDFSSPTRVENSWASKGQNETQAQYNARYVSDHNYTYTGLDTIGSYISSLDTLTGSTPALRHYNVSAITAEDSSCVNSLLAAGSSTTIIGQRYIDLATQTNGVVGSLCDTNFSGTLNSIQEKILELSTEFYLQRAPNVSSIVVDVNSVTISQDPVNGWTYDSANNGIIFHGNAIPPSGADIGVNFDPVTIK